MRVITWTVIAAACALAACAQTYRPAPSSSGTAPVAPARTPRTATIHNLHRVTAECPMDVAGVVVTSEAIDGGVALLFTTQTGDALELRCRVGRMAEGLERRHAPFVRAIGDVLTGDIAVEVLLIDRPDGALLELRARSSDDVVPLRERVRANAVQMMSGTCPGVDLAS